MNYEHHSISVILKERHVNIVGKASDDMIEAPTKDELINRMSRFWMTYKKDYIISFHRYIYTVIKSTSTEMDLLKEGLMYKQGDEFIPSRAM